jgi:uncharacterized HAD superfamily protein
LIAPSIHFCIDIDNVIAQTDEVLRRVIKDFTKGRVQLTYEDIVTFNYYECRDARGNQITEQEWKDVHDLFSEHKYLMQIRPMPGAIDGLRRIAERGTVHLVTTRLRKGRKATFEWLDVHAFPDHDLHFLKHGEKHLSLRPFTAAVDDDYEQARAFARETRCFLIRHPWNRSGALIRNVEWVDSWKELIGRLL